MQTFLVLLPGKTTTKKVCTDQAGKPYRCNLFLASFSGKTAQKVCTDDLEKLRKHMKTSCFPTPSVGEDCGQGVLHGLVGLGWSGEDLGGWKV